MPLLHLHAAFYMTLWVNPLVSVFLHKALSHLLILSCEHINDDDDDDDDDDLASATTRPNNYSVPSNFFKVNN